MLLPLLTVNNQSMAKSLQPEPLSPLIKDPSLVKIVDEPHLNVTTYSLKNFHDDGRQVMLGHGLLSTPPGIGIKDETGMGATTMEIDSLRDSLLIFPTIPLAFSKYEKHDGLFVGTNPRTGSPTPNAEILKFINSMGGKSKKIFCVVDSLPRLMKCFEQSTENPHSYFAFWDETDSGQLDSNFRKSMNIAFSIFKKWPREYRCTMSATHLGLSDPEMKKDRVNIFRYENQKKRHVLLLNTNCFIQTTFIKIVETLRANPNEKIVVALSCFHSIRELKKMLLAEPAFLRKDKIQILCSSYSKEDAGEYYGTIVKGRISATLTFITSAYYTGIDIMDQYHSIVVCAPKDRKLAISELRYKQITGRARNGLISETLVFEVCQPEALQCLSKKDLIPLAKKQLAHLESIKTLFKSSLKMIHGLLGNKRIEQGQLAIDGYELIFEEAPQNFKISYLSIDALTELERTNRSVFASHLKMKKAVEKFAIVELQTIEHSKKLKKSRIPVISSAELDQISLGLGEAASCKMPVLDLHESTRAGREAFELYNKYFNRVEPQYLKRQILKAMMNQNEDLQTTTKSGATKQLKALGEALWYACLSLSEQPKLYISTELHLGETWSREELTKTINDAFKMACMADYDCSNFIRRIFHVHEKEAGIIKLLSFKVDPAKVKTTSLKMSGTFTSINSLLANIPN